MMSNLPHWLINWNSDRKFIPAYYDPFLPKMPYHGKDHIMSFELNNAPSLDAFCAGVFHDSDYDPKRKDNEERACFAFGNFRQEHPYALEHASYERVSDLIMTTRDHVKYFDPSDAEIWWLHYNDLAYLRETDLEKIVATEKRIFKEYQFTPWEEYRERRIKLLKYYAEHPLVNESTVAKITAFLTTWTPRIAIFAGSFNPMHIGHLDVIRQAEQIFDKVIIAQGQNLEKEANEANLLALQTIRFHEKTKYDGSLFAFLNEMQKKYPTVTFVRALRNNDDLEHETIIHNYQKDYTTVPTVYFLANAELRHVSSGAIKQLQKVGQNVERYLVQ